jgi:hypothetical protein
MKPTASRPQALEALRDFFDRRQIGLILIGMPGLGSPPNRESRAVHDQAPALHQRPLRPEMGPIAEAIGGSRRHLS